MRPIVLLPILLTIGQLLGQSKIDSLESLLKQGNLSDQQRVMILNDLGYENWIVNTEKSIEYGRQALDLARKTDNAQEIARARRIIGVSYWAQGHPKRALENLTASREIYQRIGNEEGVANCLLNKGMVYADIQEFSRARALYEKAINLFTKLNLKGRIATTYTKMADILLAQDRLYDAKTYLNNALAIHSENQFTYGMSEVHNRLGRLFITEGELEQAEYHIRQSIILGSAVGDEDGKISNLILFGKLLRLKKEFEPSEVHLKLAVDGADKKQLKKYKLSALDELRQLKREEGKLAESLTYYDQYIALRDSIYSTDKSKQIAALEFSNELQEKSRQLEYLNTLQKSDSQIKWLLTGGISLITLLSIFLILSLRLKNKNQRDLLASREHLNNTALENQRLKQVELENQLYFKNKELASYALNFVQKNELLENLHTKIKAAKQAPAKNQSRYLHEIDLAIRQHKNSEKDWEDFKIHFDKVHSNFLKCLKDQFPDLTANDLKVAALARLNLNIKETSGILGISPESAKTARYRLRKKLKLEQDEDLFAMLSGLDQNIESS